MCIYIYICICNGMYICIYTYTDMCKVHFDFNRWNLLTSTVAGWWFCFRPDGKSALEPSRGFVCTYTHREYDPTIHYIPKGSRYLILATRSQKPQYTHIYIYTHTHIHMHIYMWSLSSTSLLMIRYLDPLGLTVAHVHLCSVWPNPRPSLEPLPPGRCDGRTARSACANAEGSARIRRLEYR